jgi:ubiquinone biosynthesis protein UbiJ
LLIQDATYLTAAELEKLDGRVVRVRAESASAPFWGMVALDGPKEEDWAAEWDHEADGPVLLEGRLSVLHHKPGFTLREWFPGFTEYRLLDTRVVR